MIILVRNEKYRISKVLTKYIITIRFLRCNLEIHMFLKQIISNYWQYILHRIISLHLIYYTNCWKNDKQDIVLMLNNSMFMRHTYLFILLDEQMNISDTLIM